MVFDGVIASVSPVGAGSQSWMFVSAIVAGLIRPGPWAPAGKVP